MPAPDPVDWAAPYGGGGYEERKHTTASMNAWIDVHVKDLEKEAMHIADRPDSFFPRYRVMVLMRLLAKIFEVNSRAEGEESNP
jgi:hypothetical protein